MASVAFGTLQVLVVDGKRSNAKLLRGILGVLGIGRISIVDNSVAALDCLRANVFDAVFCDDECGPMNPAAFATALRQDPTIRGHRVPFILISGAPQRRRVEIARDCGINGFLVVPLSINTVKRKLLSVLLTPKPFVKVQGFAGPDRRRRNGEGESGSASGAREGRTRKWRRRRTDQPATPAP